MQSCQTSSSQTVQEWMHRGIALSPTPCHVDIKPTMSILLLKQSQYKAVKRMSRTCLCVWSPWNFASLVFFTSLHLLSCNVFFITSYVVFFFYVLLCESSVYTCCVIQNPMKEQTRGHLHNDKGINKCFRRLKHVTHFTCDSFTQLKLVDLLATAADTGR